MQKVCDGWGPLECRTVYEVSCRTKYLERQPGKYVGETDCEKLPVEICGAGCDYQEGAEECHEKVITAIVEIPEEVCDLNPQKICKSITKLVPRLKPSQECTIIPQEICSVVFSAPRKVNKPLLTKWCLDDSAGAEGQSITVNSPGESANRMDTFNDPPEKVCPLEKQVEEKDNNFDHGDSGFEVEEVRTSVERNLQSNHNRLDGSVNEFVKPHQIFSADSNQLIEDEDISDIANPFEDDVATLTPSSDLSEQEREDLEHFNLGIHIEHFRGRIDEKGFQTQDFEDFVDFEHF